MSSIIQRVKNLTEKIHSKNAGICILAQEQQAEIDRGEKTPADFGVNICRKRKPDEPLYLVVDEP